MQSSRPDWSRLAVWSLPLAAACLLYAGFLGNPTVFDDIPFFESRFLERRQGLEYGLTLRWFGFATLGWTLALPGNDIVWHRVFNMLIHGANGVLLAVLVNRLLATRAGDPRPAFWIGPAIGVLFVLHPVAVYAAGYVIQRTILLATLFSLATWLALWHGVERRSHRWLAASAAFFFLAVFSKEHAVTAAAAAVLLLWVIPGNPAGHLRFARPALLAYVLIALVVSLTARGLIGSAYEPAAADMLSALEARHGFDDPFLREHALALSSMLQSLLFFKYLLLWVAPNPAWMAVDMREAFPVAFLQWPSAAGPVALAAWAGAGALLFMRERTRLPGLAMLAPLALFAVEFSAVRIQEPFVLYRSYLWMPVALVAPALLLARLAPAHAAIVASVVAALFAAVAVERLDTFSDRLRLWQDSARLLDGRDDVLGASRIYNNIAFAHRERGEAREALEWYARAITNSPRLALAYSDRAAVYMDLGDTARAQADLRAALGHLEQSSDITANRNPFVQALVHYNVALLAHRAGDIAGALEHYDRSIKLHPNKTSLNNRGAIHLRRGQHDAALSDFDRALALDAAHATAHHGRGLTLRALGRTAAAAESFRTGCALGFRDSCAALRSGGQPGAR